MSYCLHTKGADPLGPAGTLDGLHVLGTSIDPESVQAGKALARRAHALPLAARHDARRARAQSPGRPALSRPTARVRLPMICAVRLVRLGAGRLVALVGVVAAFVAAATPAAAATFGTPLGTAPFNAPPTYTTDCSGYWTPFLGLTARVLAGGAPEPGDVLYLDPRADARRGERRRRRKHLARAARDRDRHPGARRVGATTGAMQVVVMRALYQNTRRRGAPTTRAASRSRAARPSRRRRTRSRPCRSTFRSPRTPTPPPEDTTTIADFDTLGFAVLEPQVPVPLYFTGDYSAPADFLWNTSMPSTVTPGSTAIPVASSWR